MQDVHRTRWVERIDGMNVTQVLSMEEMSFNKEKSYNNETSSKAGSLLSTVSNFQFLVSLVVKVQAYNGGYATLKGKNSHLHFRLPTHILNRNQDGFQPKQVAMDKYEASS